MVFFSQLSYKVNYFSVTILSIIPIITKISYIDEIYLYNIDLIDLCIYTF